VFGPGFGFVLGSTWLFASALLTAGSGRGCCFRCWPRRGRLGAGPLPRGFEVGPRIAMLAGYGVVAAYGSGSR
jgi:energy-coupling factor transport system substrate-specific component